MTLYEIDHKLVKLVVANPKAAALVLDLAFRTLTEIADDHPEIRPKIESRLNEAIQHLEETAAND